MNHKIAIIASSIHPQKQAHLLEWYDDLSKSDLNCQLFVGTKITAVPQAINYKLNSKWEKIKYILKGKIPAKNQPLIDYNPHVIHLLTSNSYTTIKNVLKKDTQLIVSFRGYDINVFPQISEANLLQTQEIFKRADTLHFISNALREKAVELGADLSKTVVIKRSLNIEKLKAYKEVFIETDKIIILSVCRLVWEKGLVYALEAVAKLSKVHKNIQYIIIGDGLDKNALSYHINRLNIHEYVLMLGALPKKDVFNYFQRASIYLQPSLEEALSNSLMEASYFRIPIVSTNTGGIPEVVVHEFTGLLAPVANSEIIFNYLSRLVANNELRIQYGNNGYNKMKVDFNRNNEVNTWLNLYNDIYL